MSNYKTRLFGRWAAQARTTRLDALPGYPRNQRGLYETDLGGSLLKKRIARPGRGKSGGFRTIVATRNGDRCFLLCGFAKSERSNMDDKEEAALKAWAKTLLDMPPAALARAEGAGEVMRVDEDA